MEFKESKNNELKKGKSGLIIGAVILLICAVIRMVIEINLKAQSVVIGTQGHDVIINILQIILVIMLLLNVFKSENSSRFITSFYIVGSLFFYIVLGIIPVAYYFDITKLVLLYLPFIVAFVVSLWMLHILNVLSGRLVLRMLATSLLIFPFFQIAEDTVILIMPQYLTLVIGGAAIEIVLDIMLLLLCVTGFVAWIYEITVSLGNRLRIIADIGYVLTAVTYVILQYALNVPLGFLWVCVIVLVSLAVVVIDIFTCVKMRQNALK